MREKITHAAASALCCAALSFALPGAAIAQPAPLAFKTCQASQVYVRVTGLQCATLQVPFDRPDLAVGNITLAVQRVPASAPRTGVIVLLAGGPGQPALPAFEELLAPLAHESALRGFELVAFDQRGTGQSEGLLCPEAAESSAADFSARIGNCGLALGATRAYYSSQESVEDLNALRQALGGTPLSLFAVSYGGRVAGMYAREYPQGVARMVLDSPVSTTGTDPLDRQALHALRRVLNEGICGAGACRSFSRDVYANLVQLIGRLHEHPMRARIYDDSGRLRSVSLTEAGVLSLLLDLDISPGVRELAPAAIAAAARGHAAPLARLTGALPATGSGDGVAAPEQASSLAPFAALAPEEDAEISLALFAATYCVENPLPWSSDSAPASRAATLRSWLAAIPAQSTAPFAPSTVAAAGALPTCLDWPATQPAPPSPTGISATPTLFLSGDDDLRTPYEQELTIAAGYSDAQLLRIPDVGHSTVSTDRSGCARNAMIEFLASGRAPASCPASKEPQALPLPPASLSEVSPLPARSPLLGKVAAAVALTLEDLHGQIGSSGGGLRGGFWRWHGAKVIVHDFVDVHGVALDGSISLLGGVDHFTVHGRLSGTLIEHGLSVTGRLGGVHVAMRLVVT